MKGDDNMADLSEIEKKITEYRDKRQQISELDKKCTELEINTLRELIAAIGLDKTVIGTSKVGREPPKVLKGVLQVHYDGYIEFHTIKKDGNPSLKSTYIYCDALFYPHIIKAMDADRIAQSLTEVFVPAAEYEKQHGKSLKEKQTERE